EVLLVVEANADAVRHAPASPCALVRSRLADSLDEKLFHLAAKAVSLHARGAGIDDVADARHGERCFRDIGREHDAAAAVRVEDAVLLLLRQPREERKNLRAARERAVREVLAQMVGRLANLAFAG